MVAASMSGQGREAASLRVAEQWVAAWEKIAKESTTILIPANPTDAASMVAQGLSIFNKLQSKEAVKQTPAECFPEPKNLDDIL